MSIVCAPELIQLTSFGCQFRAAG